MSPFTSNLVLNFQILISKCRLHSEDKVELNLGFCKSCIFILQMIMKLLNIIFLISLPVIYTEIVEASITGNKSVNITTGINGLEKIILRQTHGSSVEVYLYGAHVTSWKNTQGEELIFVSSKAIFSPPKAIRGGIPVIFPQFSNLGSLPSHGFARNRFWIIDNNPHPIASDVINGVFVDLLLKSTDEDLKIWPHRFEFRLRVTLKPGGDLMLTSNIKNIDEQPFTFTFAHHSYFSVSNISEVEVKGLENLDYLDNLKNRTRYTEQGNAITINSEFDRIYLNTPRKITILDHEKKRSFAVKKYGLPDAVVWNPWAIKAKTIVDFGENDYKYMVCVEAAAIEKPITLKPGEVWNAKLELSSRH